MPIVVFAGRKGGCGKTTGATNFAAYLASQGEQVAVLDADPERQAQSFAALRARQPTLTQFPFEYVSGDIRRTVIGMAAEYKWVVVDTPGLDSIETKRAVAIAHLAVFPFKTSIYDLKTMPLADHLVQEVQSVRPDMIGICYPSETGSGPAGEANREKARGRLDGMDALKIARGFTVARNAYKVSADAGAGVVEWHDKKAAKEFEALAKELMSYVV